MRRRMLGQTGLRVSELALGTWGLSGDGYGPTAPEEQDAVIERARALGITLFDTADCYGRGDMEARLGRILGTDPKAVFVTKVGTDLEDVPPRKRFDVPYVSARIEASRKRLGRDAIDVLLLHNPSSAVFGDRALADCLEAQRSQGVLRCWGVSAGSAEVVRRAVDVGAQVVSVPFNAFHPVLLNEVSYELENKGVGVLVHSVLAYGLLCGMWSATREFPVGDHRAERWTPDQLRTRIRQLDALRPAVGGPVSSLRSAALRFVLSQATISSAILGPRSKMQLYQLVRDAGKGPEYLSSKKLTALEARLREVGVAG